MVRLIIYAHDILSLYKINVPRGVAVASSEDLGCDEEHGLKICNAASNPTKDYQKPLGMVYSPGRTR